jgi:hypothetical protein
MMATAPSAPCGEGAHAVRAHIVEGHWLQSFLHGQRDARRKKRLLAAWKKRPRNFFRGRKNLLGVRGLAKHQSIRTIESAECLFRGIISLVCTENLNPNIAVMKSVKDRV